MRKKIDFIKVVLCLKTENRPQIKRIEMKIRPASALLWCTFILTLSCSPDEAYLNPDSASHELMVGDMLFQDLDCGEMCDAIEAVTQGYQGAQLSHLGMVSRVELDHVYVIEAIGEGVVETPLEKFLSRSRDKNSKPKVLVFRLSTVWRSEVPQAVNKFQDLLGKPYDEAFLMDNDSFYCSELVYKLFNTQDTLENPFRLRPMTFKEPGTDHFYPVWAEHYENLGMEIPEGKLGLNPGGMSKSPHLTYVGKYGNPDGFEPKHP